VIDAIQQRWEAVFTPRSTADRPRYKASSEVHAAREALSSAAAALAEVEALLAEQEQVREAYEQAEAVLARISRERPRQEQEQKDLEVRLQRCRQLAEQIGRDDLILQGLRQRLQPLRNDQQQLHEQTRLAEELDQALGPLKEGVQRLQEKLPDAEAERRSARQTLETLRTRTAQAEKDLQIIEQRLERTRLRGRITQLDERLTQVERLDERLRGIQEDLARLPDIDARAVERLRRHQTELQKAEATAAALATGLEVIRAGRPVLLDGSPLAEGETRQFGDPALLCIGDDVALRLLPGGGTSTSDARRQLEEAGRTLGQALQRWKVDSVEEAATAERRRSDLIAEREGVVEQRGDSDPGELRRSRRVLAARLAALTTGLDGTEGELEDPAGLQSRLEQELERARGGRSAARGAEQQQQHTVTAAEERVETLSGQIRAAEAAIATDQKRLVQARTLIDAIRQRRGSAEALTAAITDLQRQVGDAGERLATLRREQEDLGPEQLGRRRQALDGALAALRQEEAKARENRIRAETRLHGDGRVDPQAEREQKQAEWEACRRELERLEKEARMLALLRRLFEEEQNAMANRYAAPLTERVGAYLRQVFPEPPVPSLAYDARSGFADLVWRRPGEALFHFEVLSTGAREQFAAALRAAMAEVLAAAYDGCLPLVFDDAFAHSDPERQLGVYRMLQQAAEQGLQVILLTCDPERTEQMRDAEVVRLSS
jgi:chromosome segregation ATPase